MGITSIQLQKVQIEHLLLDTHVIAHRLHDKQACGEPITIENFVIDRIIYCIACIIIDNDLTCYFPDCDVQRRASDFHYRDGNIL